jgi:hypothetical protein
MVDPEEFFEGFDHDPGSVRPAKIHWLATTQSMKASFMYYDIAPPMGPVMTRLLSGHTSHYDRLLEILPNLTKLQLIPYLHGPQTKSRAPDAECWSLLSLPATHVCQAPYESRHFQIGPRPSPTTTIMHNHVNDYLGDPRLADIIGDTGGSAITALTYPIWAPHEAFAFKKINEHSSWHCFREHIVNYLRVSAYGHTNRPDKFKIGIYGWLDTRLTTRRYNIMTKLANGCLYDMDHERFDGTSFNLDIEFGHLNKRPICAVCGE